MHGDEALPLLETNADRILAEIGINFIDDEALALWRAAGAPIKGQRVRMPPGLCRELIASDPRQFIQHARNPARSVQVGGDATVFVPAYGAPFVSGDGGNRRYATLADFENLVKLAYLRPGLRHSGGTVCEPVDRPVNKRHLEMVHAHQGPTQARTINNRLVQLIGGGDAVIDQMQGLAPQRLLQTVGQMAIDLAPDNRGMHADPAIKIGRPPNYGQVGFGAADHFDQR